MTTTDTPSFFPAYIPWLLAFGISVVLMSTDIYAPSLPAMVSEFSASEADLQWTLSVNSFGYFLASPFVGPLSDGYGRKPVMLLSLLCFIVASLGCAIAPTLFAFDVWRFVQGMFSAAIPIVCIAVLADMLQGRRFATMMAYMGIVITLSFAIGPIIGGFIGEYYGWRHLFYGVALAGLLIFVLYYFLLPETLKEKAPFSFGGMYRTYKSMFKDPIFLLYGMITSLMLAGFFAYITSSSYLYIDQFGLSKIQFGVVTGIGMVTNAFAHLVVGRLIASFGARKVLRAGISFVTTSALTMAWMTFLDVKSAYILLAPVLLYNMALGFTFPPTSSIALERFRHATGAASAFLAAFRMIFLGLGSYFAGKAYDGTLASISSLMILFASLTVVSYLWVSVLQHRKKQGLANI
tara:strand:- start:962 stop:2182 length:1221 start_codon:yes stop_codon:yes gene_type:complete